MKGVVVQLGRLVFAVTFAAAQTTPVAVQNVHINRAGGNVEIDITLSAPVVPSDQVVDGPPRLVLDFPNTTANTLQQHIAVNTNGIREVRYALHAASPLVTRVVVDMDQSLPYQVRSAGNHVIVTLAPALSARATQRQMPAAAASGGVFSVFHKRGPSPSKVPNDDTLSQPFPPRPPTPQSTNGTVKAGVTPASAPAATASAPGAKNTPAAVKASAVSGAAEFPASSMGTAKTSSAEVPAVQQRSTSSGFSSATAHTADASAKDAGKETVASAKGFDAVSPVLAPKTGPALTVVPNADLAALTSMNADPNLKTVFKVKYVAEGVAYLDGGRSSGLAEGMKLEIKETDLAVHQGTIAESSDPRVVAELEVVAVAETSAVTDIHVPKRPVKQGDLAYLSGGDARALVQKRTLSATRKYPVVVTFTEDDPQDEEARAEVPRPPLPSVNRARGWIGVDHMGTITQTTPSTTNSDIGLVVRADVTRIGGSYWNLTGYWRGRLSSRTAATQQTLQDLINRTYHLGLTYENPGSRFVAGIGRLYLPWAPSLNTIDGGYFGIRMGHATAGLFAGSTPDPTSWNYNPDQRTGGAFINLQGGSYEGLYLTSTSGAGVLTRIWTIDRPFVFFENTLSYKRYLSIYDSLQADSPRGNAVVAAPGPGLGRNFLTVRFQPHPRIEFSLNHNYFRDIPTFDPALIGTGLLDKYLFQGFSGGARIEVIKQIFLYGDIGRSNRTGDVQNSLNQMVGINFNRLPWLGLRADAHYSRFNSSFGSGSYQAATLSREVTDTLRLSVLAGTQTYSSTLATNNRSRFINGNAEWSIGTHYFMQGGFTVNRGGNLSYNQWLMTFGWRFDTKAKHR